MPLESTSNNPTLIYPRYSYAAAGAGGGFATVIFLHPLDTLRTRLQSTYKPSPSRPGDAIRTFSRIVLNEGASALYKGVIPAGVGSVVSWACYFHWFQTANAFLIPYINNDTASHLLAGTISGMLTSIATNPIWVVKVRLQLQSITSSATSSASLNENRKPYNGLVDGLVRIAREEGMKGLYKGIGPSLILVSHGAVQFTMYEKLKKWIRNGQVETSISHSLFASTGSKLVASIATYPLQVARTRMQERFANREKYGRVDKAFLYILRTQGMSGLYKGLSANIIRVTPQAAVTFITYEQILKLFARHSQKRAN